MNNPKRFECRWLVLFAVLLAVLAGRPPAVKADLKEIQQAGVLRHLGIPYANFITGSGDGLDVDIIKLFAAHLGVRYEFIPTTWEQWTGDLIGSRVEVKGDEIRMVEPSDIQGDLIACGLTVLPWREKVVDFSRPTFPTQVWLLTRGDSPVKPIQPSQNIKRDIETVNSLLKDRTIKEVMGKKGTCLDPELYDLYRTGASCKLANLNLNELAPALIAGEAESILLDVPDALVALEKWTGQLKVIGPISELQSMSVGFPKSSPELRQAFDEFFERYARSGSYLKAGHEILSQCRRLLSRLFPGVERRRCPSLIIGRKPYERRGKRKGEPTAAASSKFLARGRWVPVTPDTWKPSRRAPSI